VVGRVCSRGGGGGCLVSASPPSRNPRRVTMAWTCWALSVVWAGQTGERHALSGACDRSVPCPIRHPRCLSEMRVPPGVAFHQQGMT
jgi:hypothetical protein